MSDSPGRFDQRSPAERSAQELRSAALAFATHRWPVLPGTYRFPAENVWRGRHGAHRLEPISDDVGAASTDPVQVAAWWAYEPYSVLLAAGRGVDAIQIAEETSTKVLEPLRRAGLRGPVAVTPVGTVLLFVASGAPAELAAPLPARLYSAGSWLPLPPTTGYRWRLAPDQLGWPRPDAIATLDVLAAILG